ncbi:MAG: YihY/virulence factor BrkB family protein [Clostridia bacterium]|nr:YihY/virulence factor BrkB family protein [Clostridia bacterium]
MRQFGWYIVSYFFSIYVNIFTNFSVIYGSLATITLILMWLYSIIYLILLGAEINVMIKEHRERFKILY